MEDKNVLGWGRGADSGYWGWHAVDMQRAGFASVGGSRRWDGSGCKEQGREQIGRWDILLKRGRTKLV